MWEYLGIIAEILVLVVIGALITTFSYPFLLIVNGIYAIAFIVLLVTSIKNFVKKYKVLKQNRHAPLAAGTFYEDNVNAHYSNYFYGITSDFNKQLWDAMKEIVEIVKDFINLIWKLVAGFEFAKILTVSLAIAVTVLTAIGGIVNFVALFAFMVIFIILFNAFYLLTYSFFMMCDRIYYSANRIQARCQNSACHAKSAFPVYVCECGAEHRNLRPGKWGIFHRKCVCGEYLPCLVGGKSKPSGICKKEMKSLCPVCHQPLSGSSISRPLGVALIGGVNSGKSTFKTAFLYDFIKNSAVQHNVQVDYSSSKFAFSQIEDYYNGDEIVPETKIGDDGYSITSFSFNLQLTKSATAREVKIYDMPGEVFENITSRDKMVHFSYIEGIVFLLDPYSLKAVVGMSEDSEKSDMRIDAMDMNALAMRLISTLEDVPEMKKHKNKFNIPVAVCINKVDTVPLRDRIGMPAAEKLLHMHPGRFKDKFEALDYLCRAFMINHDKGNVVQLIDNNFETVHYFSCTSMGYMPKGGKRTKFNPENVSAAVNWLFSRVDRQFDSVFDEYSIKDMSEEQKKLGREDISYYLEIESSLN